MSSNKGPVNGTGRVSSITGFPAGNTEPLPDPGDESIVVFYGGWPLSALRCCPVGQQCMCQGQDWYDRYKWTARTGYYRVLLPFPETMCRTWREQLGRLAAVDPSWQPAPVVVAVTAMMVRLTATGAYGPGRAFRCNEILPDGYRVEIGVRNGRVHVGGFWDDDRNVDVGLAAARRL